MTFQVQIVGSLENPDIRVTGEEFHIIKNEEFAKFQLDIERMKSHFENGWGIGRPKSIYLRNKDLPWGDQSYARYGLEDVTVRKKAVSARILSIETAPLIALGLPAYNALDFPVKVKLEASFTLSESLTSTWNAEASGSESVEVGIEVGGEAVGAKASVKSTTTLSASYGEGGSTTNDRTIGSAAGLEIELPPKSSAQAKLTATSGRMIVLVDYQTSIEGSVWIDYGHPVRRRPGDKPHSFFFEPAALSVPKPILLDRNTLQFDTYVNYRLDAEPVEAVGSSAP